MIFGRSTLLRALAVVTLAATIGAASAGATVRAGCSSGSTRVSGGCYYACTLQANTGFAAIVLVSKDLGRVLDECAALYRLAGGRSNYTQLLGFKVPATISRHMLCTYARGPDIFAIYSRPDLRAIERKIMCTAHAYAGFVKTSG